MKVKLLTAAIALLITQSTFAIPVQEITCPTVADLQSKGVSAALHDAPNQWYGIEWKHNFNTKDQWTLVVGPLIHAGNESEAIAEGNKAISRLVYIEQDKRGDQTLCYYYFDGVPAIGGATTITPALEGPNQNIKFLRK